MYQPNLLSDLSEFLSMDENLLEILLPAGSLIHAYEFNASRRRMLTDKEFYINNNSQLLDLASWYMDPNRLKVVDKYVNAVKDLMPKGCRILDVGSGIGYISLRLAEEGFKVNTIELNELCIEFMIFQSDKYKIKLGINEELDDQYELILCLDTLEHLGLAELSDILALIRSKLNKNGRTLVNYTNTKDTHFPMHYFLNPTRAIVIKSYKDIFDRSLL